jgi:ribosomal-protein-alanine N-acetyltransferase
MAGPDLIRTNRLVLRRARPDDVDAMHAILSDSRAMRYWSTIPHVERVQTEQWMADMLAIDGATGDDFIVEMDGRLVGKLGCWKLPEMGYILAPEVWGLGVASEALAAFLDHRRAMPAPRTLTADVDPRNLASLKLLKRHGFIETGRAKGSWKVGDEFCDSVYLSLSL